MTTWNQKAREAFPDLTFELEESEATIYTHFFELLPRCIEAHVAGNTPELQKIYGFAEWCMGRDEQDVRNAAGVAFFEHLVDQVETLDLIPPSTTLRYVPRRPG